MRLVLTRYDASGADPFICRGMFLLNVAKELIQLCNIRIEQICISVYVPQKQFKSKTSNLTTAPERNTQKISLHQIKP